MHDTVSVETYIQGLVPVGNLSCGESNDGVKLLNKPNENRYLHLDSEILHEKFVKIIHGETVNAKQTTHKSRVLQKVRIKVRMMILVWTDFPRDKKSTNHNRK